ncbi:MAG: DNA cytosine methyltransferase [Saprospiraceae bacterium]|jgi:DNA (cytosine-5)-methyltransferase 1|nr:DNA cytosine methyltransferase [Saprospiraceae bacterium]
MKNKETYKAISLFTGAGGMDIGVSQSGFEILTCIEIDPNACATLRENIKRSNSDTKVIEGDIRKVSPLALMHDLGLKPGDLDLLCGGPPCQSFSQIGKRGSLSDERGLLLFEMVRFAEIFQPKALLIEQVKGLLNAPDEHDLKGGVFKKLIDQLEALDYVPKWRVINAAQYGVPQLRERVFIIATKKPNGFQFPNPSHIREKDSHSLFSLTPFVTVGDVLTGLDSPNKVNGHIPEDSHLDITPEGDRFRINGVPEGGHLASQVHLPIEQRKGLTKKDTTKFKRLSRTAPSNTLRCGEIFFHPIEDRYLTPREYMRIHGYPDNYVLCGPIRGRSGSVRNLDQHRQVANSVPPPVAKALSSAIIKTLKEKILITNA